MAQSKSYSYNNKLGYEALSPIKTQEKTLQHTSQPASSSDYAFPIFVIVVLSILATVLLLLSYFTFLTKYCSNWHQVNPMRWISILRTRRGEDPFIAFSPAMWNRGLDESIIREIPTFQFIKGEEGDEEHDSVYGCVVCLAEFKEHDVVKVLPNCNHAFHLDCIDIWLQTNSNCPLCRSSISGNNNNNTHCPLDHIIAPSSSPQDSQFLPNMGSDEDFVVIELGGESGGVVQQERNDDSRGRSLAHRNHHSTRKCHHVSIMGDECIDIRKKDEQFLIQPIRRSFSMDSAHDRQTYLDAQVIIQHNRHHNEAGASEDCNRRYTRAFFPFCYGKGSKNAVLPLENE